MIYLIDTHVLLWWLNGDGRLGKKTKKIIAKSRVLVSTAVIWEIVIKIKLGKLEIPGLVEEALADNGFDTLDIKLKHVLALDELPTHHSDPFDRIQIAQARSEGMTLITADRRILLYDEIRLIPADD
ncbi:MAG: type II toxin-antitoxin system VapC family toxin [Balneolaceae bacterium]|nr:MAG: type II toxin-antitoxin system VapC family toxin [Balneolaceae bacterium]